MMFSQFNLYIWDESADDLNSTIVSFNLEPCRSQQTSNTTSRRRRGIEHQQQQHRVKRNSDASVLESDEPFGMEVNMQVEPDMEFMNATPIDSFKMLYSVMNVSDPVQPIHIKVVPVNNQTLNVFAKMDENPSPEDFVWSKTVPGNVSEEYPELAYTLLLPAANLTNGTVFVGVQLGECDVAEDCETPGDLLQYYISIQNGGCRVWDETNEMWIFDTCEVCSSTHMYIECMLVSN